MIKLFFKSEAIYRSTPLVAAPPVLAPTEYFYLRQAKMESSEIYGTFSLVNLLI